MFFVYARACSAPGMELPPSLVRRLERLSKQNVTTLREFAVLSSTTLLRDVTVTGWAFA